MVKLDKAIQELKYNVRSFPSKSYKRIVSLLYDSPFYYQQGNKKNILLFSSRRGGSTYLAELVASNPGIVYIDQPFDLFKPNTESGKIRANYLPNKLMSQFVSLSGDEEKKIDHYTKLLLNGKLKLLGNLRHHKFPVLADRTMLKICNALPLIDWFNNQFNVLTCYLVRHPIAQALSIMKNNWGITAEYYLDDENFRNNYLNNKQLNYSKDILKQGSYFQKAILNWCVENLVPLKHSQTNIIKVYYEHLVVDEQKTVNFLCQNIDVESDYLVQKIKANNPSGSSKFSDQQTKQASY